MIPGPDLILLGLRGSGKTTLAARLGRELSRPVIDLDERTPGYAGCATVAETFQRLGEPGFRDAEARALADVLDAQDADAPRVIALGGGTPTAITLDGRRAADLLREAQQAGRCVVVYLRLTPGALRARLHGSDNTHRPPLIAASATEEVEAVFLARDPLYRNLAGAVLETDTMDEPTATRAVIVALHDVSNRQA